MANPLKQSVFSFEEYRQKIRQQKPDYTDRMLSINEVAEKLNVSRRTAYRTVSAEGFPKRKRFSASVVRWSESEIDIWIKNR